MEAVWEEILEQIRSVSKDIAAGVNPPADPSELRLLEETAGVKFCEYLSSLNGQRNTEEETRDRNA